MNEGQKEEMNERIEGAHRKGLLKAHKKWLKANKKWKRRLKKQMKIKEIKMKDKMSQARKRGNFFLYVCAWLEEIYLE